jgi:hypothetical protein
MIEFNSILFAPPALEPHTLVCGVKCHSPLVGCDDQSIWAPTLSLKAPSHQIEERTGWLGLGGLGASRHKAPRRQRQTD